MDSILERASRAIPRDDVDGEPSTTSARTFAVGLSGGVDSAIAAWALKRTGARVVGTLARNWDEANEDDGDERECAYVEDRKSARECAETLGLDDFVEVDFRREYWLDVFEPYVEAFESGNGAFAGSVAAGFEFGGEHKGGLPASRLEDRFASLGLGLAAKR